MVSLPCALSTSYIDVLRRGKRNNETVSGIVHPREHGLTFGHKAVMSLPAHNEFAETFVPTVARQNANAAKNAAALLSHWSISFKGSQITLP